MDHTMNSSDKVISEFLIHISEEKGFSKHTIAAYKYDLNCFLSFLMEYDTNIAMDLNKVDRSCIRHFLAKELENALSSKTTARRLASIKSFFKYLKQIGKVEDNPSIHVKTPKVEKKIPTFIQENKINELMNMPDRATMTGKRDHAMLELFYATGIRLSELVGLNIGSVDHSNNLIKVLGKGNKERIIPFGDNAKDAIETYLNSRGSGWSSKPNTPLFTSQNDKRISARTVQQRLRQYLQSILGGKNGASPHTLRHTFGTHLLDNDADIRSIQELLGHSSISSTQIYTKVNPQKIKKIYKKAHPHAS